MKTFTYLGKLFYSHSDIWYRAQSKTDHLSFLKTDYSYDFQISVENVANVYVIHIHNQNIMP